MEQINSLYFDDIAIENQFRNLLKERFLQEDVYALYNRDINFVTMDIDEQEEVDLPAVTFYVYQSSPINSDDVQLQRFTPFSVEIEVYTSGEEKVLKNRQLCNIIIQLLQSNGPLDTHYCRGLSIRENTEANSMLDSAYRRVIRMTGLCDNELKLIKGD